MPIPSDQFEQLIPLACAWAAQQEADILARGVALTPLQLQDSKIAGITNPGKVRILRVERIPTPLNDELAQAGKITGLISPFTSGMAIHHGIFVRSDYWNDRGLLLHEMVHVRQYEQLGGIEPFLRQYLWECLTVGYPESPLEQEAVRIASGVK